MSANVLIVSLLLMELGTMTLLLKPGAHIYAFGQHYEIVGYGERDGEPALRLRNVGKPLDRPTVITRLVQRAALPSGLGVRA